MRVVNGLDLFACVVFGLCFDVVVCLLFTSVWFVWFGFVNSVALLPLLFGYGGLVSGILVAVSCLWFLLLVFCA